jgi:hypothetical protein
VITLDDLSLDDLSLEALAAAAAAGGTPSGFGPLADLSDLPLMVAVLDARLALLDMRVTQLEGGADG